MEWCLNYRYNVQLDGQNGWCDRMCLNIVECFQLLIVYLSLASVIHQLLVREIVGDSDDEDAEVRCKENIDLAVATDVSNAEVYHTLASYWLSKGDRQVINSKCNVWLLV